MTRREEAAILRRRHIEEMRLAVANGWSLKQAKAEMRSLRIAARNALFNDTARPPVPLPVASEPADRPLLWWQRD